jgi:hypothetical protein
LNFSNSCIYTCQNGLLANYAEETGTSIPPNMVSSIHPMPLDLYGLSATPPAPSSPGTPNNLTSPIDTIPATTKQDPNSPVIYPWMRKVHINNPG